MKEGHRSSSCIACSKRSAACDYSNIIDRIEHQKKENEAERFCKLQEQANGLAKEVARIKMSEEVANRVESASNAALNAAERALDLVTELLKLQKEMNARVDRATKRVDAMMIELNMHSPEEDYADEEEDTLGEK
jgi:hypothetical protein